MLVQGTGFNWPAADHFRIVFLPHEDDLREAISRIARFLEHYRKTHGTDRTPSAIKLVAVRA
jgi:alanine-synthesizing transaminase